MNKAKIFFKQTIIILLLSLLISLLGSTALFANKVLSGGATNRGPVLGGNFFGGFPHFAGEAECDFGIADWFSIAPRLGLARDWLSPGCSFRFGIIQGIRPHGFWVGPAIDLGFGVWHKRDRVLVLVPSVEFGWRFTFDFGLSLQAFLRGGIVFWDFVDPYVAFGVGVGYAFN